MTESDPKILGREGETLPAATPFYEAPGIEVVLTAEELEREALYAGTGSIPICPP